MAMRPTINGNEREQNGHENAQNGHENAQNGHENAQNGHENAQNGHEINILYKLTAKEQQVLNVIKLEQGNTIAQISQLTFISERTVRRILASLVLKNIIIRVGSDIKGKWTAK